MGYVGKGRGWGPVGGGGQNSSIGLLKKKAKADTHKHLSQYEKNKKICWSSVVLDKK